MTDRVPSVSVVVLNFRGADDTIACLDGLRGVDWPSDRLQVVVVDNASGDDSVRRIRAAAPWVELVEAGSNTGFAGGCNRGAKAATGEYLAFLNNDARPDPAWLAAAIPVLRTDPTIGCVASKVLDWEGRTIDFVDAAMSFDGQGYKLQVGGVPGPEHDIDRDILFASGAAMVMPRHVFEKVGGFDERYFMFFEDVDLGWRLWLLGHRVRYVAGSVAFHRHHRSMAGVGRWREHYLLERNSLFTIYKNYDDEHLAKVMPAALALSIRRGAVRGGDDADALDLRRRPDGDDPSSLLASKDLLASTFAVDAFVRALPSLSAERARLQAARVRPDHEITRLFRLPMHANVDDPAFVGSFDDVTTAFEVEGVFSKRRRIVVATGDVLRPAMAGPAIRAWQIARALSGEHEVILATKQRCELSHPDFEIRQVDNSGMDTLEAWCDVFIFQGFLMHEHPCLQHSSKVIVCDIYDPFHLEQLEQARDLGEHRRTEVVRSSTQVLNQQLQRGDLFMCASAKQRDFWLGQLAAVGRINPRTYDDAENLSSLISVVPFGVGDTPPVADGPAMRGVIPGIGADDRIILWGGGIYNWFDPLTLIRAIGKLSTERSDVRLVFMGIKHPNPDVPEMRMAVRSKQLADDLGLTGRSVFFNEAWVAYDRRQNFLLEADIGVSTHFDHIETEFSFRTRILDYLWASLPIICTEGDSLADLVERRNLGLTVPPEDVDALAAAIGRLLDDDDLRRQCLAALPDTAAEMRWMHALEPLVEFCRSPHRAPDLLNGDLGDMQDLTPAPTGRRITRLPSRARREMVHVRHALATGGLRKVVAKSIGRLRRRRA